MTINTNSDTNPDTNTRFVYKSKDIPLTSFKSPTVTPPILRKVLNFYRGPLPSTNTNPDSLIAFYELSGYKSQRIYQPALS